MTGKKIVGIDIAKRSLKIVRYNEDGKNHQWLDSRTTETGIQKLFKWLTVNDIIVMEAGTMSFRLAKRIQNEKGCEVIILNPGDVQLIYKSLKKTDAEDALKLARIAARNPREELPEVRIPTDEEESLRALSTEQEHWNKIITMNKNRLHGIFHQSGLTTITKKHLRTNKNRIQVLKLLEGSALYSQAERLNKSIGEMEQKLQLVNNEITIKLKALKQTQLIMSIPGLGPITTLAIVGYLGDFSRFKNVKQIGNYVGFVPRIDQSGDHLYHGAIIKRGPKALKRALVQGAWSLVRSPYGGAIRAFYEKLINQGKNKKIAIIATSRKILTILHTMMKTGEFFDSMPLDVLDKKLKYYGLI